MNARSPTPNQLIHYLPAIYQEDEFIGKFILGFEKILLGIDDKVLWPPSDGVKFQHQGLEETITTLSTFFDPQRAPKDFLNWLAGWVALSLRDDWEEEAQRQFISRIVPLYQLRGTKRGLIEMLQIYTGGMGVKVYELIKPLQIAVTCTVGVDTAIGGGPPHYFRVKMFVDAFDPQVRERKKQIARAIIEQEKPSHTYYELLVETPTMQIEVHSTVGVDTLLGTPRN